MGDITKIVNNGAQIVNKALEKNATTTQNISTPIANCAEKLTSALESLAANAQSSIPKAKPIFQIDERGRKILDSLKQNDPEKYALTAATLKNTFIDKSICQETLSDFIENLANLGNVTTLKKALNSKVKFQLVKSDSTASFTRTKMGNLITLCESSKGTNNTSSLSHELGHAFDYNTPIIENGLHRNLIPKIEINPNGKYEFYGHKVDLLGYKPNSYTLVPNQDGSLKEVGVIRDNACFSKEFNHAYQKDTKHLLEIDKQNGQKKGTTFTNLLSDWSEDSLFGYYLGGNKKNKKIQMHTLKKEMFAQMAAIATNGYSARKGFDDKALEYFPNMYKFVSDLIKSQS